MLIYEYKYIYIIIHTRICIYTHIHEYIHNFSPHTETYGKINLIPNFVIIHYNWDPKTKFSNWSKIETICNKSSFTQLCMCIYIHIYWIFVHVCL